ncbi:hypothetical protein [Desulfuribacillus stibiiarsenatis]|uniref:hypothetical protein n=1 Tax=Desulfuribacillus stibiiarsenatis TaxID=1390249 RepID=UPI00114CCCE1|nr:hypothetical protein [Desulfuribacillus stibiiarsenatis]
MAIVLVSSLALLSACGSQADEKKGVDQLQPSSPNENTKPTTGNSDGKNDGSPNDKPTDYKDRGDAVDRFYGALEKGQPIFLYFYTDT